MPPSETSTEVLSLIAERDQVITRLKKGWSIIDAEGGDTPRTPKRDHLFEHWRGLLRTYESICEQIRVLGGPLG